MAVDFTRPIRTSEQTVKPQWCDYNGHMNVAYYTLAFENAAFEAQEVIDFGERYVKEEKRSIFTTKGSYTYLDELSVGSPLYIDYYILDHAAKLFHVLMEMYHAEKQTLVAYTEQMMMHVDLEQRGSIPISEEKIQLLESYQSGHAAHERPRGFGEAVGIKKKT